MKLVAKPWNWDKATLAFRKHHEHGLPRRYRRASLRQLKAAQKQAETSIHFPCTTRLAQTIYMMERRRLCEEADARYYGHS